MSENVNDCFANIGAQLASKIPYVDNVNCTITGFEDILELESMELENVGIKSVAKKCCIYKSSGLPRISSRFFDIFKC